MNYIWDYLIKSNKQGIPEKNITFTLSKNFSPYAELSMPIINTTEIEHKVEINPYYRFCEIFKDLLDVNYLEYPELKDTLFDILVHFLANIDFIQGMNKHEYYLRFIYKEIKNGLFGNDMAEKIELFNSGEKEIILNNIYGLYTTGQTLYLLKDTVENVFEKSILYIFSEDINEVLFFANTQYTNQNEDKLEFIKNIFLPIKYKIEVYWENHFGVIGVDEIMKIDKIQLF